MSPVAPLLVDLGNRRLKLLLDGELHAYAWADDADRARLSELLDGRPQCAVLISSSSPEGLQALQPILDGHAVHVVRAAEIPLARATEGTGTDRLLVAWAAYAAAGGPVLVADCGTAYTVDLVDDEGCFRGGAIGPGLAAAEQALANSCPHLAAPAAEGGAELPADTAAATRAGTRLGLAAAIDGLAVRWEAAAELAAGTTRRVLTGGDAAGLAPFLEGWDLRERLLFDGLARLAALER